MPGMCFRCAQMHIVVDEDQAVCVTDVVVGESVPVPATTPVVLGLEFKSKKLPLAF